MNYAVIFAGGTGQRMKSHNLPKQLLKVHGKPIIVHTVEKFQNCQEIDGIVLVCYEPTIPYIEELKVSYGLSKVLAIIPGGITGQESIYLGLKKVKEFSKNVNDLVLMHDGVRPLINEQLLCNNIEIARTYGNCVTVAKSIETVVITEDNKIASVVDRSFCRNAKAPQTFKLGDILAAHESARVAGKNDYIDSAMLMRHYGHELHTTECGQENIKITTQMDFYMFKAILDAEEMLQVETYTLDK